MSEIILNLLIVFIVQNQFLVYAQNMCEKVDFNRDTSELNEFGPCVGESLIVLKINSYAATTIEPFRPTSQFHLSATDIGLSCLQSTTTFTLDSNSEIRTAIFLSWDVFGAWVEIQIVDGDGELVDIVARLEESIGWVSFYGNVNRSIENAQIEIKANMNAGSTLAIEYVYVLNSDSIDDECRDIETERPVTDEPTTATTGEPTDETTNEITELPTDGTTNEPSDEPTDETTNESTDETTADTPTENPSMTTNDSTMTTPQEPIQISPSSIFVWMSLSILFFITTVASLAGIYYFVWLYRKVILTRRSITNVKTTANLPRLIVTNSDSGNHLIVGIDKH